MVLLLLNIDMNEVLRHQSMSQNTIRSKAIIHYSLLNDEKKMNQNEIRSYKEIIHK